MEAKKFVEEKYQEFKEVWAANSVDPRWKKFAIKVAKDAYNQGLEDASNNLTQTGGQFNSDFTSQRLSILNLKVK